MDLKQLVAWIFGLGLVGNAILFIPQIIAVWRKRSDEGVSLLTFGGFTLLQVVGIAHGLLQHDPSITLGMAASLCTCGSVVLLTLYFRLRRRAGQSA